MKKYFKLLPILFLALTGCSGNNKDDSSNANSNDNTSDNSGGTNDGGTEKHDGSENLGALKAALKAISDADEYKANYETIETHKKEIVNWGGGMFPALPGVKTETRRGISFVKGKNTAEDYSNLSSIEHVEYCLSEVLGLTGMTRQQADETLASYAAILSDYGIDDEKDLLWVDVDESSMIGTNLSVTMYDEDIKQYKHGEFNGNKMVYGVWIPLGIDQYSAMSVNSLLNYIQENEEKVVLNDGIYKIDLSANPVVVSDSELYELSFAIQDSKYILEMKSRDNELEMHHKAEIYDLGNCGYAFNDFEIPCPFNHVASVLYPYDTTHDRACCAYCYKFTDEIIHECDFDEKHHACIDCFQHVTHEVNDAIFKLKNGTTIARMRQGENSLYYDGQINWTEADFSTYPYEDETEICYFWDDQLLVLNEPISQEAFGTCSIENKYKMIFYKNVQPSLTQEQLDAIASNPSSKSSILLSGFDFSVSKSTLKTNFESKKVAEYEYYKLERHHTYEEPVPVVSGCFEGWYNTCAHCGQANVGGDYNHSYHIVTSAVEGQPGTFSFVPGTCTKCGEEDNSVYFCSPNLYHEIYGTFAYTADYSGRGSFTIPHSDENHDGYCDICGALGLTLTHAEKQYTFYISADGSQVLSGPSIWQEYGDPYMDENMEFYCQDYDFVGGDHIVGTYSYFNDYDHDQKIVKFAIGEDEVSRVMPLN